MAGQAESDAGKRLVLAYQAVLFIAGMSLAIGLIAVLFDVQFLKQFGHGFSSLLSGSFFLILAHFVRRRSMTALGIAIGVYLLDGIAFLAFLPKMTTPPVGGLILRGFLAYLMFRGIGAIRELRSAPAISGHPIRSTYPPGFPSTAAARASPVMSDIQPSGNHPLSATLSASSSSMPQAISFVAPSQNGSAAKNKPLVIVAGKSSSEEVPSGTVRFSTYRCEIDSYGIRAVYVNGTQREIEWRNVTSLVVRQLPMNSPWDGKLVLDILSIAPGRLKAPIRILSSTFVNYTVLPQGQSTSSRENMRRLGEYMWERNPSIYMDPGTVSFLRGGRPPVRFANMTEFAQYDSRFGS